MKEVLKDYPQLTDYAIEAAKRAGVAAELRPIRGGTDGSRLTARGLPTPNLFTGGHNFHGKLEFNSRKGLEKSTETLLNLVQIWAERAKIIIDEESISTCLFCCRIHYGRPGSDRGRQIDRGIGEVSGNVERSDVTASDREDDPGHPAAHMDPRGLPT